MNLRDHLNGLTRPELLKMLLKAGFASGPFTGGISQIWSDLEQKKKDVLIMNTLKYLLEKSENPNIEEKELKLLLESRISKLSEEKDSIPKNEFKNILKDILNENIPVQLNSINVDGTNQINSAIDTLLSKPRFSKEIYKGTGKSNFLEDLNLMQKNSGKFISQTLGISHNNIQTEKYLKDNNYQINVAFTPIMLAVSSIFFYLKHSKKYNINLEYSFAHAIELAECIIDGSIKKIHACVLGDAPSLQVINNTKPKFHFVSFLPRTEQKVVSAKTKKTKRVDVSEGEYVFIGDKISTTLFHYEDWKNKGIINPNRTKIQSLEPHESINILKKKNPEQKLLVWSPHWQLYEKLSIGSPVKIDNNEQYWFDSMLFLQHTFTRDKNRTNAFLIAIKDAWFSLRDPNVLRQVIDYMLSDNNYVEFIRRYVGYDRLINES